MRKKHVEFILLGLNNFTVKYCLFLIRLQEGSSYSEILSRNSTSFLCYVICFKYILKSGRPGAHQSYFEGYTFQPLWSGICVRTMGQHVIQLGLLGRSWIKLTFHTYDSSAHKSLFFLQL